MKLLFPSLGNNAMSLRNRVLTFGMDMVLSKRRKLTTHSHALVPQRNGL